MADSSTNRINDLRTSGTHQTPVGRYPAERLLGSSSSYAALLDAMVAKALGGDVPKPSGRRPSRGGSGYVISGFHAADADALAYLNRPKVKSKRTIFLELCLDACIRFPHDTTNSKEHLPVGAILQYVDGDDVGPHPDHPVFAACRNFPPMRNAVAKYKPEDMVHGLTFVEFDEIDVYFEELIRCNMLKPEPKKKAAAAAA